MKHGDFTNLAENYSKYRPDYSQSVLTAIIALLGKPVSKLDLVDVGAGTGIWTRMLASLNPHSMTAVEPNGEMRKQGMNQNGSLNIKWLEGSGENTGLPDKSVDMVSMASSFHWVDFEKGTQEFHRILKDDGRFVALWNPRYLDESPLQLEIENHLKVLNPEMTRVSSGKSGITQNLSSMLWGSKYFTDVVFLEGRHSIQMPIQRYIGAWESVNDIRVQLGEAKFSQFMDFVKTKTKNMNEIEVSYTTRAWSAKKLTK